MIVPFSKQMTLKATTHRASTAGVGVLGIGVAISKSLNPLCSNDRMPYHSCPFKAHFKLQTLYCFCTVAARGAIQSNANSVNFLTRLTWVALIKCINAYGL